MGMSMPTAMAVGAYMGVNMLFLLKYGGRLGLGCSLVLCVGYVLVLHVVYRKWVERICKLPRGVVVGCVAALGGLLAVQLAIDPYQVQVDRWSAIHNFLSYLLQGRYPYAAQTHLGGYGSPFPVWQLLHLPFYVVGNVGLSLFACLGVYLHSLYKWQGRRVMASACLLLVFSSALWYEGAVRSDLMANFLLVAALIQYLIYYKVALDRHLMAIAVGCGLLLSTRLSVAVPLFIYFLSSYMQLKWSKKLCFSLVVMVVFGLTFLPFLLWSDQLLSFEYNPFVLQTRQGHTMDALLLMAMLIVAGVMVRRTYRHYFITTGMVLIGAVALVFAHNMLLRGDFTALFSSLYDITYFDMSLPFVITAMSLSGKVASTPTNRG